eukprot:609078-Pyramimonas_sp.AAC.1
MQSRGPRGPEEARRCQSLESAMDRGGHSAPGSGPRALVYNKSCSGRPTPSRTTSAKSRSRRKRWKPGHS